MTTVIIPQANAPRRTHSGIKAEQYIDLPGCSTADGQNCLRVDTWKGRNSVETHYSFGRVKSSNGFEAFTCMLGSDFSARIPHKAKRATLKAVAEAHQHALTPEVINPILQACAEKHGLEITL